MNAVVATAPRASNSSLTVFGVLGDQFPALQWHGDTFALPPGAVHLGRSAAYPNQAFRFGEVAYAVQFHVEVTDPMLAEWRLVGADGAVLQTGRSFATVAGDGRLQNITGFFDA